jgi:protein-disulfide isomerase
MASRKQEKEERKKERLEAESKAAAEDRRRKLFAGLGAAALAAVVVVVALVAISQSGDEDGGEVAGSAEVESELAGLPQRGTLLGERGSDVRVIEFGDLQCPACAEFSAGVIPEVIEGPIRDGEAQLEFRNFTIIGPDSEVAARAALAAGEQDRLWQFVELFYRNQGPENGGYVTDEFLTEIAGGAGVPDLEAWEEDRSDPRWDEQLAETQQLAVEEGIQATPSVIVEGPGGSENLGSFPSAEQIEAAITKVS